MDSDDNSMTGLESDFVLFPETPTNPRTPLAKIDAISHASPVNEQELLKADVIPSDFDIGSQEDVMAGTAPGSLTTYPVELLHGSWLSPLELVTCPDLNASLPLKLPKKKKTEQ